MPNPSTRKDIVLDASAWIEYLRGTTKGAHVEKEIAHKRATMCAFNIMEVCVHARRTGADDELVARATLDQMHVMPVDAELAINASRLYTEARKKRKKFSYGDALALMTADALGARLLTCDTDFAGLKGAKLIS